MVFEVKTQEDIPQIIEFLVLQGVLIYSVTSQRASLEEIFLK